MNASSPHPLNEIATKLNKKIKTRYFGKANDVNDLDIPTTLNLKLFYPKIIVRCLLKVQAVQNI